MVISIKRVQVSADPKKASAAITKHKRNAADKVKPPHWLHCAYFILLSKKIPSKRNDRGGTLSPSPQQNSNRRPPKKNKKIYVKINVFTAEAENRNNS